MFDYFSMSRVTGYNYITKPVLSWTRAHRCWSNPYGKAYGQVPSARPEDERDFVSDG